MRNSCWVVATSFVLFGAVACSGTSVGSATSDGGTPEDASTTDAEGGGASEGGSGPVLAPSGSGDAGPKKPTPSEPACQSGQTYDGPQGNCTLESTYQCETPAGFDAFRVACSCPSATCGCYTNGTLTKTVAFNGCPACTSPVELAKLCGVAGY